MRHLNGIRILVVTFMFTAGPATLGQQMYPLNGNFDDNISGWEYLGDAAGSMSWDGSIGMPAPGSLKLETIDTFDTYMALSDCIPVVQDTDWEVTAMIFEAPGSVNVECFAVMAFYNEPDCSGLGPIVPANVPSVPAGSWQPFSYNTTIFPGIRGARVSLKISAGSAGSCNFDDVTLTGPPIAAPAIPTLDRTGVAILVVLLLTCGTLWLHRSGQL